MLRLILSRTIIQETPRAVLQSISNVWIYLTPIQHIGTPTLKQTDSLGRTGSYNRTIWSWKVTYAGLSPTFNNVFYLSVISADGSDSFTSRYFNISDAESTSPATAAATSSASPSSTTPAAQAVPTSQSPPLPPATVTSKSLRSTDSTPINTIVAVAFGAVAGTLLLAGAAWWAWTKTKKKRNNEKTPGAQQPAPSYYSAQPISQEVDSNQVHELSRTERTQMYELQETERRRMFELEGSGREART
ncbi:MAG: hypothetical protein Q9186_000034 [Xanthomendoza sp. 1 TL-2023]